MRPLGEKVDSPAEERRGRGHVAAGEGAPARRAEMAGGAAAELLGLRVERGQLEEVAARLLEVIADDLLELELAAALAVDALGPPGKARVQPGSRALRQPVVRGVADEDVLEAERLGGVGLDPV